jgi:transcriptional regulator with PAS, ATPase and Fis domain
LLESELFGHEKGAFTGALVRKLGKFELANNGTLLLDEISEMHPHLQAKLLRVLQENEIDRVGGRHPIPINVRMIATTNQDLTELIQKNEFREDLYYRLQVISFTLPPLRERRGDVPLLAEYFLQRYAQLFGKQNVKLTAPALTALERATWPGNIRQLENAVARRVLLAEGNFVHPRDLKTDNVSEVLERAPLPSPAGDKPVTLREMEQQLIYQALDETSGNRTHAAKMLGISVRTLRNKLHEYRQIAPPGPTPRSQVA